MSFSSSAGGLVAKLRKSGREKKQIRRKGKKERKSRRGGQLDVFGLLPSSGRFTADRERERELTM